MEMTKKELGQKFDRIILYLIEERGAARTQSEWDYLHNGAIACRGLQREATRRESHESQEEVTTG